MAIPDLPQPANVGDKVQVRIVGRIEGQETNNILHFASAGGDTDIELHLILVLINCFVTNLLPVLTSQWTMEKVVWKRVSPTLGPEFVTTGHGMGQGTGSASALPSFASVVFSLRTTLGGKSGRGRMYLPGIPEDATTNSQLTVANPFWTAILAFAACMIAAFVVGDPPPANSWQWEVYSRKIGGDHFPYGANGFNPVKNVTPQQLIGTTRSRKVGRGA